jgi:hypothetical protein
MNSGSVGSPESFGQNNMTSLPRSDGCKMRMIHVLLSCLLLAGCVSPVAPDSQSHRNADENCFKEELNQTRLWFAFDGPVGIGDLVRDAQRKANAVLPLGSQIQIVLVPQSPGKTTSLPEPADETSSTKEQPKDVQVLDRLHLVSVFDIVTIIAQTCGLSVECEPDGRTIVLYAKDQYPNQLDAQIAGLRAIIIPPTGASMADVEAVFGRPNVTDDIDINRKATAKASRKDTFQLLPPNGMEEFRAFLQVTYKDGKVSATDMNHMCVVKGRTLPHDPKELEAENRQVLADLIEIKKKYEVKLRTASWNG